MALKQLEAARKAAGVQSQKPRWLEGTQLLGILLRRFSGGRPVTITKADVEAANFETTHPVVFTIHEGGEQIDLHVALPGERFSISSAPTDVTTQ